MEHAKGWVRAGHRVTWLTATYPGAKPESIVDGVHFVRRAGTYTVYLYAWAYLLANSRLVDVIVDEVHGFPFFSPLFTRKPVVVFIHEIAGEIWDYMFPFPKNVIGKFLERWYFRLYRRCRFWTDAASTIDELVAKGIPRAQCTAIPCPIIVDKKIKIEGKGVPKEKRPTFLFVSRVVRMKGVEEVIKAFSFIIRAKQQAQLWIVGGGEESYIRELIEMIRQYGAEGNVKFFGNVTERKKYDLMARAHLLLHASVKEGWGLVVLEAASVGTPAVVYNVGGLRDVVKNGKTGIVIENNTPVEMAQESLKLLDDQDRYEKYQEGGKAWVASLKWSDVVRRSLAIIKKAV
jgi:glycosyltransferase involved in cell wall biosynthesis